MGNLFVLVTFASIAVVAIAVVTIYFVVYMRSINKRLCESQNSKKMWPPLKVCIVTIITALVVFGAIMGIFAASNPSKSIGDSYKQASYNADIYQPQDMENGYLSMYSISENLGYTKYIKDIGDVRYTYFISDEDYNSYHPAFLIFAEYIGNAKMVYYDTDCSFQTIDGKEINSVSASERENRKYICFIGNASADCSISCIVDYYNGEKESIDFQKLYTDNEALTFVLSNQK